MLTKEWQLIEASHASITGRHQKGFEIKESEAYVDEIFAAEKARGLFTTLQVWHKATRAHDGVPTCCNSLPRGVNPKFSAPAAGYTTTNYLQFSEASYSFKNLTLLLR